MIIGGGGVVSAAMNRKYLKKFKQAGGVGENNAKALEELDLKEDVVIKRLIAIKALGKNAGGYFITESFSNTKRYQRI